MKYRILFGIILIFASGFHTIAQSDLPKTDIDFEIIGSINPRKANEIKESNLGIGCEVLGRDFANYDSYKEYLGNLGVKHARFQSGWAKTEQEKGVYNFEWLDHIIDDCLSRGIQPWINTCYGNPIYEGGGSMQSSSKLPNTKQALDAWDKYVYALVDKFKDRVFEWEIWNEIDHGKFNASTPEDYGRFFIRTAEIIRELQPKSTIIAFALAGVGDTPFVRVFFDYLKDNGKLDLVDKVSFHGYPTNPDTRFEKSSALINLIKEYDERIVAFQGETGSPSTKGSSGALSGYPFTELIQAKWDLRRSLAHIGRGIPFSLFTLSEFNYPGNRLNTKGKLKINEKLEIVHVKQSYYSYQNLTSIFDHSLKAVYPNDCEIESDSLSSIYAFTEGKNKISMVAYWNSGNIPNNEVTTFNSELTIKSAVIKNPVLVDVRTGLIYNIPESSIKKNGGELVFQVPIYDSPLLICDSKLLRNRNLIK